MRSKSISFILVAALAALSSAVRFDLHASTPDSVIPKCFFQYVPKDTKVLVTVNVADGYNQRVDFEVCIFILFIGIYNIYVCMCFINQFLYLLLLLKYLYNRLVKMEKHLMYFLRKKILRTILTMLLTLLKMEILRFVLQIHSMKVHIYLLN